MTRAEREAAWTDDGVPAALFGVLHAAVDTRVSLKICTSGRFAEGRNVLDVGVYCEAPLPEPERMNLRDAGFDYFDLEGFDGFSESWVWRAA